MGGPSLVMKTYVVAKKPMPMGDHQRQVGELVPEVADWGQRIRDTYLELGYVEEVRLISDQDRAAYAERLKAEEDARDEAARNAPKPEPQHRQPPEPKPAFRLFCANCQGWLNFWEDQPDNFWFDCPHCNQRQCVLQARKQNLQLSSPPLGHAPGHNRAPSNWKA